MIRLTFLALFFVLHGSLTVEGFDLEVIAHRGASHDAPENTSASVNLAWKQGADAVEIDVVSVLAKDLVQANCLSSERWSGIRAEDERDGSAARRG